MTPYQRLILSEAILLAQKEFETDLATEDNLKKMDEWIEAYGKKHGIDWVISHQTSNPDPLTGLSRRLTFTADIRTPAATSTKYMN